MMITMIFFCPVGMLTISDFINILRYYYKSPLVRLVLNSKFLLQPRQSLIVITFRVVVKVISQFSYSQVQIDELEEHDIQAFRG